MSMRQVSLLERMLAEQVKQTELLEQIAKNQAVLIQALADEQDVDVDDMPQAYLSGAPVHGGR
ncbi:hypothetical protein [Pseudomonas fontis]|uniref:Uncharacterized protein n=1 Tax=Pseudomonas fontis TaxID=2942633 RepID=A0ABT5NMN7_9PSED|nr:hypothetical protein [Pseudomonas fontis]MDD0974966.1 hypothetical protein [Pseudomonas fontis]MDD0989407.1 hypothetical protein [Pseudomonas fontis]